MQLLTLLRGKNRVLFKNFSFFQPKLARILASEAIMQEQINSAMGVAKAIELEADARRNALEKITEALNKVGGKVPHVKLSTNTKNLIFFIR